MNLHSFFKTAETPAGPSKAEEIEALETMAEGVNRGPTYLSGLFTRDMVEWASQNIRDDLGLDLFGMFRRTVDALEDTRQLLDETREECVRTTDETREACTRAIEDIKANYDRNRTEDEDFQKRLVDECAKLRGQADDLREILDEDAWRLLHAGFLMEKLDKLATGAWLENRDVKPQEIRDIVNELRGVIIPKPVPAETIPVEVQWTEDD